MNKKYPYTAVNLILLLLLLSCIMLFVIKKKTEQKILTSNHLLKDKLDLSVVLLGNYVDSALQKTNEALILSTLSNQKEYQIQSLELLSAIKNIKGQTNQSLDMYEHIRGLAIRDRYTNEVCKINIEIGKIYYGWGQFDTSLRYFKKALDSSEKNHLWQLTSSALHCMGKYYMVIGKFDEANLYFQRAIHIARAFNDCNQIVSILNTEGKYYIGEGNLPAAFQCYQEAYHLCENCKDQLLLAEVYNYMGGLYLLTNQFEKSLELHKKALQLRNTMDNPEGKAKSYNNIGKAYLELHNLDSAATCFKESILLCKLTYYKKGLVKALSNLGSVYYMQGKTDASEKMLLQALGLSEKAGYKLGMAESSQVLGDICRQRGMIEKALTYYRLSINCLDKLNFDDLLCKNYQGLFSCYQHKGDYPQALHYHILLLDAEKKLLNVENQRQLSILQMTYAMERREKDNQVLRKENELKEMTIKRKTTFLWFIICFLFSSILVCLYIYNRFYSKTKANLRLEQLNQKIVNQNLVLEKLNKELNSANDEKDKLFSIIAHELRNPLYWFQNLSEVLSKKFHIMSPDMIQKTLSALDESSKNAFHLMDNLLHWSRSKLNRITTRKSHFPLQELITESTRLFETILAYKQITLELYVPDQTVIYADANLFNCIIRNLLSNAIKYTPNHGTISIHSFEKETHHTIRVSDSGTGIPGDMIEKLLNSNEYVSLPGLMEEKGSGLGLKLCKEFVELNGGMIWLESKENEGTQFYFTIPKLTNQTSTSELLRSEIS